ncbi:MAG: hypothetical protein MUC95_09810, partial [Spirochaetes bacterium]|nr:hypothetical protein [Spirochaetota bacterium]
YWHRMSPDRRLELAARYGLYDAALPPAVKGRYAVKVMLVNRLTVGPMRLLARLLRRRCFGMSDRLYRAAFGYYLRREFHSSFHIFIPKIINS